MDGLASVQRSSAEQNESEGERPSTVEGAGSWSVAVEVAQQTLDRDEADGRGLPLTLTPVESVDPSAPRPAAACCEDSPAEEEAVGQTLRFQLRELAVESWC